MPSKARWAAMGPEEKNKYRQWTRNWQERNRERMREINRNYYAKNGRIRQDVYHKRHKRVRWTDEFTKFVTLESHDLRKRRNEYTGVEWHVDHIIPLKGKEVSGLHIWSNLQVIPARLNYSKRNRVVEETTKFPS
jgi:hypothetical protein